MKKTGVLVLIFMLLFTVSSFAVRYDANIEINSVEMEKEEDINGEIKYTYKKVTKTKSGKIDSDDYDRETYTLEHFVNQTKHKTGINGGVEVPYKLIKNGTSYTFDGTKTSILHKEVDFKGSWLKPNSVLKNDLDQLKASVDNTYNSYLNNQNRVDIVFDADVVEFAGYYNLPDVSNIPINGIMKYTLDVEEVFEETGYKYTIQTNYSSKQKVNLGIGNVMVYRPFYSTSNNTEYYYIDSVELNAIRNASKELRDYIYNKFKDVTVSIKEFKVTNDKINLNSSLGTGSILRNSIKTFSDSRLTVGEQINMLTDSTISFSGNKLNISKDFEDVYKEYTKKRPTLFQKGIREFVIVEYPFYQITDGLYDSKTDTFLFTYGHSNSDINLITEEVISEDGVATGINSGKFGNPKNFKLQNKGGIHVLADTLMEAIEVKDTIYHTGRVLHIENDKLSPTSIIKYDNQELQSITSTNLSYYIFEDEDGGKYLKVKHLPTVGSCIILNMDYLDESGLVAFIDSNLATTVAQKNNVNLSQLRSLLSGEYAVGTFELSKEQVLAVQRISTELERRGIDNKLRLVRVGLVIFGMACIAYSVILLLSYLMDRSGGVFGIQLLPIITLNKMRVDHDINASSDGILRVGGRTKARLYTIVITLSLIGLSCSTGLTFRVIVDILYRIYGRLVG